MMFTSRPAQWLKWVILGVVATSLPSTCNWLLRQSRSWESCFTCSSSSWRTYQQNRRSDFPNTVKWAVCNKRKSTAALGKAIWKSQTRTKHKNIPSVEILIYVLEMPTTHVLLNHSLRGIFKSRILSTSITDSHQFVLLVCIWWKK